MPAGQPKKIKSEEDLLKKIKAFVDDIRDSGYDRLPTKTSFADFLNIDLKTLYNTLNKYFPNIKKEAESVLAECFVAGAAMGKWNTTIVIFALKNWFGWADKQEVKTEQTVNLSDAVKDVERLMDDAENNG